MLLLHWKVNHLKVVLEKKRDPISQVTLIETIKKVRMKSHDNDDALGQIRSFLVANLISTVGNCL